MLAGETQLVKVVCVSLLHLTLYLQTLCTYTSVCSVDDVGNEVCRYFVLTPGGLVQVCLGWGFLDQISCDPLFLTSCRLDLEVQVGSGGYP